MAATTLNVLSDDDMVFARLRAASGRRMVSRLRAPIELEQLPVGSLVVVDTALPGLPPFADARWRTWCGHLSLIVASSSPRDEEGIAVLEAGASGYCHAYAAPATLAQVIEVVASGELWVGRNLLSRLLGGVQRGVAAHPPQTGNHAWESLLTEREREVAHRAAIGDSNHDIAARLGITERTVKAHLTATFEKLGVTDRLQLALKVHGIR